MTDWIAIGVFVLMAIGIYSAAIHKEMKKFKKKNEDDNEVKYVKRPLSSSDSNNSIEE